MANRETNTDLFSQSQQADSKNRKLAIIIPCYNEEAVLRQTHKRLTEVADLLKKEHFDTTLVLVDDGSKDQTWAVIEQLCTEDNHTSGLKLSHNVGHQRCLWAGLTETANNFDAMITIDADLQDDENTIVDMARQFAGGTDVVYGIRRSRLTDSFWKRTTAQMFYALMRKADPDMLCNHADYRLMSQRAVKALLQYPERNLYLRGLVREIGFSEGFVYYDRKSRQAGETKYPLAKMVRLSLDGITSFSVAPLHLITAIGLCMMILSVVAIGWILFEYISRHTIQGWTSILASLWLIGGVVTTTIGIIGIYIGKIYTEVKRRPHYFIEHRKNI